MAVNLDDLLFKTSRTFALAIPLLPEPTGRAVSVAYLLFRIADTLKPFPANRLERLPGGIGIMADDVMAGVYANLALRLCMWSFGRLVI